MDGFNEVDGVRTRAARHDGPGDLEQREQVPEPASPILTVVPVHSGEQAVIVLAGDVDISTAGQVRAAAERCLLQHPQRLSIDLSGLQFCDGSGVRVLRGALESADAAGVEFRLVALNDGIRQVFILADAEDLLAVAGESTRDGYPR